MFTVKTPQEAIQILREHFRASLPEEAVPLSECVGRVLAQTITASEYVPGFHRSTVDGFAVRASDTFGCSDAIPALLSVSQEIHMGESAAEPLSPGCCAAIPTGGALPEGADAVVMIEYTEDYGDGTIGILKPVSPGGNMIYRGDDVFPGKPVLPAGRLLTPADIGALAAMGYPQVPVIRRPVVGILSTGDELVPVEAVPADGQIRDVNSAMLAAFCEAEHAVPRIYGIIPDIPSLLTEALERALSECDLLLISGGSSVGAKDATAAVIEAHGEILFHGIAMKPGKPTILGKADGKPVFGLPGHPVAAYFISRLFVREALSCLTGAAPADHTFPAQLTEALSTNHGRSEVCGVRLAEKDGVLLAAPIHTKSGLISSLAGSDGFITIPRDCEGLPAGAAVSVHCFH